MLLLPSPPLPPPGVPRLLRRASRWQPRAGPRTQGPGRRAPPGRVLVQPPAAGDAAASRLCLSSGTRGPGCPRRWVRVGPPRPGGRRWSGPGARRRPASLGTAPRGSTGCPRGCDRERERASGSRGGECDQAPHPAPGHCFALGPARAGCRVPGAALPPRPLCARSQGRRLPIATAPSPPRGGCLLSGLVGPEPARGALELLQKASPSASVPLRVGRAGCSPIGARKGGEPCAPPSAPWGRALGPQVHPARRGPSPGWVPV